MSTELLLDLYESCDQGWQYKQYVLSNCQLDAKHTGQNIADAINRTHEEFNLSKRKLHYVTDQEANMISAGKLLKFTRSTCMAHLLDPVIAKDSIPKVDELAGDKAARYSQLFWKRCPRFTPTQKRMLMRTKVALTENPEEQQVWELLEPRRFR